MPLSIQSYIPNCVKSIDVANLKRSSTITSFKLASWLSDPPCKTRELYYSIKVADDRNPNAWNSTYSKVKHYAYKAFLGLLLGCSALLAIITTLPGIALRSAASNLQEKPYLYFKGEAVEKKFESNEFTHLNWNICATPGGYAITDGGVVPWEERIDRIIAKIEEADTDVVSLFEVFDLKAAFYLQEKLKSKYSHFYFNIGPRWVGPNSGIFVASKYEIQNPEFIVYPKKTLVGRTKNAEKGIFKIDLVSGGKIFATLFDTHLQHSEIPAKPVRNIDVKRLKDSEVNARALQMNILTGKIDSIRDRCIVVAGDFNMDDEEHGKSPWSHRLVTGNLQYGDQLTWGGDAYCARLMNKPPSKALNLDRTMIVERTAQNIETSLIETYFDANLISTIALSDHRGLISKIRCNNDNSA